MARSDIGFGVAFAIIGLAACGADTGEEARSGMATRTGRPEAVRQDVRACSVLDLAAARRVIGPRTEHPGGDTEASTCMYVNAGVATLTLQLGQAGLYDRITIPEPHTMVQIGDRGRYNVQEQGGVAVQFVSGAHSATMTARPIGKSQSQYLDPVISAAREVAARLRSSRD
jgi:hypothetical protein